jgi:hypothetical protein
MEDTITTLEDKVAMLVAMGATATKEEARRTLEESGGNIDRAISLLDHVSSSRNVRGAYLHHDDDGVNKRSLVTRERLQESLPQRQETRYQGLSTPSFSMMAISTDSSAARRRRDEVDEDDTSGSTNMVESSYQELPSGSQYVNIQKGAFPIHGTNPSVVSDTYSVTPPPQSHEAFAVAARVVDRYEENCEEVLRRQEERINQQERELEHFRRTQELQERLRQREEFVENQQKELEELRQARQGGIVFGEIISRDNDGDEQVDVDTARDNNKRPPASDNMQASSLNRPSSSKRNIVIGLVVILACVGIAVGLVFALRPKSTTEPAAISSTAPQTAPTSPSSTMADLLSSVSFDEGAALGIPGTPQNMAYNWLVENINIDTYSDKTKIQRYVLATLFYSTNGDSWTANSGWLGNENECGWSGILCTYDSIMELMLSDSNLVGTIPGEIGLLSDSLEMLGLDLNSLTGTIPSTFGMLTSLTDLSLFENKLNGTIPSEIGKLTNLPSLELFNNTLRGEIPSEVGQMVDLRYLYLFNNELSGAIPSEVGGMTVLRTLALDGNDLTGTIPLEVGRMTSLSNLRLYENSLMGHSANIYWHIDELDFLIFVCK